MNVCLFDYITSMLNGESNWLQNMISKHNGSLSASGFSRVPDFILFLVHHQFALISQLKAAHVAVRFGGVCVPHGFAPLVVHDQVAVSLHAQAERGWPYSVWSPHRLPAIDHKVTIILQQKQRRLLTVCSKTIAFVACTLIRVSRAQIFWVTHLEDSLKRCVVGHQMVSLAELIIFGQEVSAHDSATKRKSVLYPFKTLKMLEHKFCELVCLLYLYYHQWFVFTEE